MKRVLTIFLLSQVLINQSMKCQDYTDMHFGREYNEVGEKLIIENDTTLLLFGWGQESSFVLYKININGDTIFTKYIDLPAFSFGIDILKCQDDDLIIIGETGGLARITSDGEIIWSTTKSGINQFAGVLVNDTCFAVAGSKKVFSHIQEIPDYGPDSVFYTDIYVTLYNLSGNLLKDLTYSFVDNDIEMSSDILYSTNGILTILGLAYYNGLPNEILLTANLSLEVKQDTLYEYPRIYTGNEIVEGSDGNLLVCGSKYTGPYNGDVLFQKIEPDGNILLEKTFDLKGVENGFSLIESNGYYFIAGQIFNSFEDTVRYHASFLLKIDNDGDTVFSKIYRFPGSQYSVNLNQLNDTTLVLFGSTAYNTYGGEDFHLIFCSQSNGYSDLQFSGYEPVISEAGFTIYPNPAKDIVYINGSDIRTLSLIDLNGKTILRLPVHEKWQEISLSGLSPGLYIIQAKTSSGIINRKLLIE